MPVTMVAEPGVLGKAMKAHPPWSPKLPAPPWSPELPALPWPPELSAPPWSPEPVLPWRLPLLFNFLQASLQGIHPPTPLDPTVLLGGGSNVTV